MVNLMDWFTLSLSLSIGLPVHTDDETDAGAAADFTCAYAGRRPMNSTKELLSNKSNTDSCPTHTVQGGGSDGGMEGVRERVREKLPTVL